MLIKKPDDIRQSEIAGEGLYALCRGLLRWTGLAGLVLAAPSLWLPSIAQAESLKFSSGGEQVTLIELFTSEGCSSCPPAEAWLSSLKTDPRLWEEIVPVAFHVDYWDYLGWKDSFSSPAHSQRQRRYQSEGGIRSVYTPGFVINGREWRGWIRQQDPVIVEKPAGRLDLTLEGSSVTAHYVEQDGGQGGYTLNLAVLAFDVRSKVTSGENSGRYLHQDFAVIGHKAVQSDAGRWDTSLPRSNTNAVQRYGLAAWVSHEGSLAPLQAVGGWIPASVVGDKQP